MLVSKSAPRPSSSTTGETSIFVPLNENAVIAPPAAARSGLNATVISAVLAVGPI